MKVYRKSLAELLNLLYIFNAQRNKCYITPINRLVSNKIETYYINLLEEQDIDAMDQLDDACTLVAKDLKNGNLFNNINENAIREWLVNDGEKEYFE